MMYQEWLRLGLEKGLEDLEIFSVRDRSLKLSVYEGKLDQNVQSDVEVVTIRGIYQEKLSTIRFENFAKRSVSAMLDELIENAKALTVKEPAIIYEGSSSYPEVEQEVYDFKSVPIEKKIRLIKRLEQGVLAHDLTKQVQTTVYQESDRTTTLINSKGLSLTRRNTYAYAYAIGVFAKADDVKTAYDIKLVKSFEAFDPDKMAKNTIEKGVAKLGGRSLASGSYPVVFSNEMFADILGVFTPIFSGEAAYRNTTPLKDKVGKAIALPTVNLIDDPLHQDAYFQMPFDDEGVACKAHKFVDQGVFTGFMHNLKTASIFKTESTGNGFGGGISPTNFYLEPSDTPFDSMIESVEHGLYITDLIGLHAGVKTVSGEFSLQAGGFYIKNGKIDHPVKMIVVSGNFFDVLNEIEAIASDMKFGLSGVGSPSVRIKSLMIGGEA
jgi:PmbA protein